MYLFLFCRKRRNCLLKKLTLLQITLLQSSTLYFSFLIYRNLLSPLKWLKQPSTDRFLDTASLTLCLASHTCAQSKTTWLLAPQLHQKCFHRKSLNGFIFSKSNRFIFIVFFTAFDTVDNSFFLERFFCPFGTCIFKLFLFSPP